MWQEREGNYDIPKLANSFNSIIQTDCARTDKFALRRAEIRRQNPKVVYIFDLYEKSKVN